MENVAFMLNKICFSSSDEKIKGHMTTLEEILQHPEFGTFHNTGKEVNGKLLLQIEAVYLIEFLLAIVFAKLNWVS